MEGLDQLDDRLRLAENEIVPPLADMAQPGRPPPFGQQGRARSRMRRRPVSQGFEPGDELVCVAFRLGVTMLPPKFDTSGAILAGLRACADRISMG